MPSASDRLDFGPTRTQGAVRAFVLALLVHALLIGALTWGVNWKRSDPSVSFEAEIWSALPQNAAPAAAEPPPPPAPLQPEAEPQVVQAPAVKTLKSEPEPEPEPEVDIAQELEKKRKLKAQAVEQDALKAKAERAERALQAKLANETAKKMAADKAKLAKQTQAIAQAKEQQNQQKQQNQAAAQQKQTQAKNNANAASAAAEKRQQDNIARMMGQAGASTGTGAANSAGSAQKSSGPSAGYGGKVRAKVKPNIVFTEDISGNPTAEVEVRTAPDGTIMSQRLAKSSGNKAWDEAVIKAIIRTETMPRDTDGRVPSPMVLEFRPKD